MIEIDSYYDGFFLASDIKEDESKYRAVPVRDGLKIMVNKSVLDSLKENSYIEGNFKLNIKQIDKDNYSIYFSKRE